MRRLRVMLFLILAALWLPATQHCGLEAAGLLVQQCLQHDSGDGCAAKNDGDGRTDACGLVESGLYRSLVSPLHAPAPQLLAADFFAFVPLLVHAPLPATGTAAPATRGRFDPPDAWIPSWQFSRRAAAPAHAPDSLIA